MKKIVALLLAVLSVFALVACNKFDPAAKSEGVMTYEEYAAAAEDAAVVIEGYVQAKQSWWENTASIYLQDPNGAYFVYKMTCSEEDYAKLTVGTKIKVTGYKTEYKGEIEVDEGATFEIITDGTWVATPTDVTALLGKDELINHQNKLISIKGVTVVASTKEGDATEYAFLYKYDGSGKQGDDLYFNVTDGTNVYNLCVESYLTGKDTEVYKAVEALKVGDTVDLEGFLYWYDGPNPHITKVTVK